MMARILCIAATALVLDTNPSLACFMAHSFQASDIVEADLVFVGQATEFTPINGSESALLTIAVIEPLKGEMQGSLVALWPAAPTLGDFKGQVMQEPMIFATFAIGHPDRWPNAALQDNRPDLPMIVQPPCAATGVQPATPALIADVKKAITP
jgi:hypothetical protein